MVENINSRGLRNISLEKVAAMTMQGMLANPQGYTPKKEHEDLHWHDALVKEAFEIAEAFSRESTFYGNFHKNSQESKEMYEETTGVKTIG
jgi:hypothetical protein